jgi:hypothetical protein
MRAREEGGGRRGGGGRGGGGGGGGGGRRRREGRSIPVKMDVHQYILIDPFIPRHLRQTVSQIRHKRRAVRALFEREVE